MKSSGNFGFFVKNFFIFLVIFLDQAPGLPLLKEPLEKYPLYRFYGNK